MLEFSFYSEGRDFKFSLGESQVEIDFYQKLMLCFSTIDFENRKIKFSCTQKMNSKIKEDVKAVISEFEHLEKSLKKIDAFVQQIPDGKYFYVFPTNIFEPSQINYLFTSLELLNQGVPFEQIEEKMKKSMDDFKALFDGITSKYDITVFSPPRKKMYGEGDKQKRTCKYCGKTVATGAKFNEEAHAISEALGNKILISAEECDECNAKFASTIEKDMLNFVQIYRVLYGKKGKNGIPKLKFENGITLGYENGHAFIFDCGSTSKINEDLATIPLKFNEPVNFMNIYRCLVKFALAVLSFEKMQYFTDTVAWINDIKNDGSNLPLPKVSVLFDSHQFADQPLLTIYERKDGDVLLPYMYCELRVGFYIFVYIIPFSSKDTTDFSVKENFDKFWQLNKHYAGTKIGTWSFYSFNKDKADPFVINLKFMSETMKSQETGKE